MLLLMLRPVTPLLLYVRSRCPTGVLSPAHTALFGASSDSAWWWTSLVFIVRDALCTWWALGYPQDFIFSASLCLVAGLVM